MAIVRKDLDTLKGIQTELTKLTGDINVISPEKAGEFEKAAVGLLSSDKYSTPSGVNIRVAATQLITEIITARNSAAAYEERRENLEALLTRVAAFVGEMKQMAEDAKKSAKAEIIEANRKRSADEARLTTEKAETDRKAREAAQLAAARAVVSDAITSPAQRDVPPLTDTPTSRDVGPTNRSAAPRHPDASASDSANRDGGEVTQADASVRLSGTSGQRPDGQGLEENDNRKAAEIAAAAEKAREKEQEKERVLAWVVDQMRVLVNGRGVLGLLGSQIGELSVQVKDDFLDAVSKLCKESGYSYTSPNDPQNITVHDRLKQISEAQDPVAEWTELKGLIDADMVKAKKLFIDVQALAATYVKRAQEVNIAASLKKRAAAEEKRKAEAAELTRKNAEVDGWLKSIDDSIDTYQREYTAIDDDMKANFPSIYDNFKYQVSIISQSPEYHSGQDYTLDVLERARQAARKASDRFEVYSVRKDSVADCLEKDTKRLAAIKELAEEMKNEAKRKANDEADAKRRANEETEAAATADARTNVGEVAPAQELDPAKAARIRQLEANMEVERSIINSPDSDPKAKEWSSSSLAEHEREYRILTHTASHEDWVAEVARLNARTATLLQQELEIRDILKYRNMNVYITKQQEDRLIKNLEEQRQHRDRLKEANEQEKLTAEAEKRIATSTPLPDGRVDGAAPVVTNEAPIFTDQEKELIQQYEGSLVALSAKLEKPDVIVEFSQEYQNAKADIQILSEEERFSDESEHVRMRLKEILTKLRESLALVDAHDREAARKKRITSFPGHTPRYINLEDAEKDIHTGIEGSGRRMTIGGKELFVKSFGVGEGGRENHTKNLMALAQTQKRFYTAAQTALGAGSVAHSDIAIGRSQSNIEVDGEYGLKNKVNTFSEYVPEGVKNTISTSEENARNITRELSDGGKYVRRLALRYPSPSSDKEEIDIRNRNRELLASQREALTQYLQAVRLGLLVGYLPDIQMQTGDFNKRVDCLIIMNSNIRLTQDGVVKLIDYGYPRLNVLSPSQMERLRARILQKEQGGEAAYTYDQASKKYNFAPWYTEALNAAFKADFEAYAQDKNGTKKLGFGDSKTQIQPAHVDPRTGQSFSPSIALGHNKIDRAQDFASADEYAANMSQILLASLTQETIRDDADQYSGYLGNIEASKALLTDALDGNEQNMQTSGAGGHTPLPEAVRGADARAGNESSKLAREQKNCARFVDEWKKYVDEQISALAALIPQAQAAMSEANLNTFREIVKEYNTALEIIDDERKKKAMVPGWEGLATAFPSDGTSGSAARFAELKTQFEQLHLQESLNYTYAVTIFKQKYIDGVASYLLELRIFSAALGRISLEGVTSRPALEQSRDQAVTDKLRKVIEMSGYGTDTVGKLATYADLYKSLSAPNSGVSHALVEPQLPVITDALGTTYQTLIVETIESAIAPTGYKTISDAIDRLREFKESVATKTGWVKIYINEFNRIPGALTKIATAASLITDPSLREVITKGNKTSDYESLAQAAELYAGIRSALDQSAKVDRSTAIGAEARVDTRVAESAPQAAQVEGFVPYLGSTRTLAEAVRTKRENDRSPRVAYLEYYQKHPEKIVSFEGTVYLLGRTFDTGVNGRVFEAFVATDEQQAAMRESMGNAYNPSVIDESWIKANTPDQFINDQGVITVAGKQLMRDSSMPDFGAAHPEHVALKFKRKSTSFIGGQLGGGDAESFKREMQAFHAFEGNKTLSEHTPHLHGAFHERFKDQAIAMSWIDGELGMSGPVSEDEVLRVADELLSMIDASEQAGCPLGQDNLKPGSVAIGPDGQVQMIDLDTDSYVGRNKNLAYTLTTLIAGSNVSYGMSELLSRISGLEDLKSADARRVQIQNIRAAIAEYRALRSLDVPTLTAQMNDPAASNSRRLAAFELLSEKMKGKVSPEQATMASQLYFDQSVNTTMSRKERDLSQSLGSTRFPADMRYLILPHIPLTETQAVQNTKDGNLDKLAEQFPANRELQSLIAALRLLSKAITQTVYREREQELKANAYGLADAYKDIPGSTLAGESAWFAKLIPYSRAKGREGVLSTARAIVGTYGNYPIYRYGLADLTGNMLPAKKIEIVRGEYPDTTKIDLKDIKDGGCIADAITYPRNSTDRPELTISNGWVSTRFVDANMTLEPSVPWSSIDKLVAKDSRITLKGGQGRHVDSWIDGAIRIAAPPEKTESSTQLFVRSVKIHEQFVTEGAKSAPVRLDIEDAAAKVLVGIGSEDIACDHKDQLYILDKSAFGEQYKINIPADYKEDSITFPAQSAEGNKNTHVVFVRRKIGSSEEWLFSHFVDDDSKSDGNGDVNREKKTEQFGQKTIDEANGLLESWTNFTQSQKTENPTLSFESDSRLLRSAISNLLNARARGQDLVKLSGLLDALEAQIPISQRNLEAAIADPVAYVKAKIQALALPKGISEVPESMSGVSREVEVPEMTDELRALIPKMYLDSFARAYKKSVIGGGFMDTTGRPFDCTYDGGTGILELRRKGSDPIRVRYTS